MTGPELFAEDLETIAKYLRFLNETTRTLSIGIGKHSIFVGDASVEVEIDVQDGDHSARVVP